MGVRWRSACTVRRVSGGDWVRKPRDSTITVSSLTRAIEMNGASVAQNLKAFAFGRWAYLYPEDACAVTAPEAAAAPKSLPEMIDFRADQLTAYQGPQLAAKYRAAVAQFEGHPLQENVLKSYHKLLSYKDEYEVARLLLDTRSKAEAAFAGDLKLTYHLAPPIVSQKGANGRPKKRAFGAMLERGLPLLARLKVLRGTPFDVFGYTAERRMERDLITQYEADLAWLKAHPDAPYDLANELAGLPLTMRGFGPVKDANVRAAAKRRDALLVEIRQAPHKQAAA